MAKSTNSVVIGICQFTLDASMLEQELVLIITKFCDIKEIGTKEV